MKLSVVIPVFNEEPSLRGLFERVQDALGTLDYEVIFVNDGSTDHSRDRIQEFMDRNPRVRCVDLDARQGQSRALFEGFRKAAGAYVVKMDADLQNDPGDIPGITARLDEGFDAVFGVRSVRSDPWHRRFQSRIANGVANLALGESFRDRACGLQGFRRECLEGLAFFDGMHRFLPSLMRGRRVCEISVAHHPRSHGQSRYAFRPRAFKALKDLFHVRRLVSR